MGEAEGAVEDNKALVARYLEAFETFDAARFLPYLADEPTYLIGNTVRQGRQGFEEVAAIGRRLYPRPQEVHNEVIAMVAEGDWVAILQRRRGPTNKVEDYDNVYTLFLEVRDGKIQTQAELMDFRTALEAFDTSSVPRQ